MKLRRRRPISDKVPLDMTPMIDIVFQLQAFFIMTFSITLNEGDFNIRMPFGATDGPPNVEMLTNLRVELAAAPSGALAGIKLGDRSLKDVRQLRGEVQGLVLGVAGPQSPYEIEFACDRELKYEHMIEAVTAVTGYRDRDGHVVKLIEKVKFAPPRAG